MAYMMKQVEIMVVSWASFWNNTKPQGSPLLHFFYPSSFCLQFQASSLILQPGELYWWVCHKWEPHVSEGRGPEREAGSINKQDQPQHVLRVTAIVKRFRLRVKASPHQSPRPRRSWILSRSDSSCWSSWCRRRGRGRYRRKRKALWQRHLDTPLPTTRRVSTLASLSSVYSILIFLLHPSYSYLLLEKCKSVILLYNYVAEDAGRGSITKDKDDTPRLNPFSDDFNFNLILLL